MPGTTANRLYPFSVPTDPADVPAALQSLAEAIDNDVCTLTNGVTGRPVAQFRGTTPFASLTTGLGGVERSVPFDTEEFDTANVTMQSMELGNRLILPEEPGFYFIMGTLQVPTLTVAGAAAIFVDINIARGDASNPAGVRTRLAGTSHNIAVNADDRNIRTFSVSTGAFFNGTTDAVCLQFFADSTPDVSEYALNQRTLTLLRMTIS